MGGALHFREPSFEEAPDGYDDDDASSADSPIHSDSDSLDELLDAFDPDEVYDRGHNQPRRRGCSDLEEPIPAEELQRNWEQLDASGYNLRRRQPGRYVNGIFRPERVEVGLHITVSKALNKFKRKALVEMYREIRQIDAKKVWHPRAIESLTRKQLKKVIRSSLFTKEKFTSTGAFEKRKARLVAGGHMQDKSIYDDVSSPTVSTAATFLVAAIAAQEHRHVATLDIGGAYLNASMKENEVLMRLDPKLAMILTKIRPDYKPFLDADGTLVVQLDKALYGCVESARL